MLGLGHGGHGFDEEEVCANAGAALGERVDLLGESCVGVVEALGSERSEPNAERSYGSSDKGFGSLFFAYGGHALAGDGDAGPVDLAHAVGEAVALEPEAIAAEGVGLDDLGAGLKILLVDSANDIRLREVEFVVAAIDEDAAAVKHGAHGAVAEHGAAVCAGVEELLRADAFLLCAHSFYVRANLCHSCPRRRARACAWAGG